MPASILEPEQRLFSVVILGDFNPVIFHPLWYAQNGLIAAQEVEDAEEVLTSQEVSMFRWNEIHFQVEQHRFGLTTKDAAKAPQLRDLAIGSFTLLEHTPLTALGLNLESRFKLENREDWDAVGHRLAPKQSWRSILEDPGMLAVSMSGTRRECAADRVSIQVSPANGLEFGVVVRINQHYTVETVRRTSLPDRNQEVIRILSEDWSDFRDYAENSAAQLVSGDDASEERTS